MSHSHSKEMVGRFKDWCNDGLEREREKCELGFRGRAASFELSWLVASQPDRWCLVKLKTPTEGSRV